MRKVLIGNATNLGVIGADYYIANYGILPNYYITRNKQKVWVGLHGKEILIK